MMFLTCVAMIGIVATGLESFHERALAAVAKSNDEERRIFRVGVNDARQFEGAHLSHISGAQNCGGHIVLERGEPK